MIESTCCIGGSPCIGGWEGHVVMIESTCCI